MDLGHKNLWSTYIVRARIERLFAFCILGRKSKFFAPGHIHATSYKSKVQPLVSLICITLGTFLPSALLIAFCITLRKSLRSDSATHAGLGALLGILLLISGVVSYALRLVGNAWREVRAPAQAFLLFVSTAHPMPTVRNSAPYRTCKNDGDRSRSNFHFLTNYTTLFVLRLWKTWRRLQVIALFANSQLHYYWHSVMKQRLEPLEMLMHPPSG